MSFGVIKDKNNSINNKNTLEVYTVISKSQKKLISENFTASMCRPQGSGAVMVFIPIITETENTSSIIFFHIQCLKFVGNASLPKTES